MPLLYKIQLKKCLYINSSFFFRAIFKEENFGMNPKWLEWEFFCVLFKIRCYVCTLVTEVEQLKAAGI